MKKNVVSSFVMCAMLTMLTGCILPVEQQSPQPRQPVTTVAVVTPPTPPPPPSRPKPPRAYHPRHAWTRDSAQRAVQRILNSRLDSERKTCVVDDNRIMIHHVKSSGKLSNKDAVEIRFVDINSADVLTRSNGYAVRIMRNRKIAFNEVFASDLVAAELVSAVDYLKRNPHPPRKPVVKAPPPKPIVKTPPRKSTRAEPKVSENYQPERQRHYVDPNPGKKNRGRGDDGRQPQKRH